MNKSCFFCGIIGIITNIILTILKLFIGLLSCSISIIIDAFNSLLDMTSSIILVAFKNKKDYIKGIIISSLMIIMSIIFMYNSVLKIINKKAIYFNKYTYIILIITFIIKIIQYIIYKKFYNKDKLQSIKIILIETRNDILNSISIIISIILFNYLNINIDGYLGLTVSIYIYINSINALTNIKKE